MTFAGLLACVLFAPQASAFAPQSAADETPSLVARIAVIGASASAGYSLRVSLADAIDAQIAAAHAAPANFAQEIFFIEPGSIGEAQVAQAAAILPTLVVAADFLFWFGYGEVANEAEHLENLDTGLELLDPLKCPLILSHFPDMTPAVGKLLLASHMPAKETLRLLDARVDAWAAARGHVAFVAMPEFIVRLRGDERFEIGGVEFKPPDAKRRLMQSDDLHPTVEGLGALARLCIDAACEPNIGAKRADFKLELAPILLSLRKLDESRAAALRPESSGEKPPPQPKPDGGGGLDGGDSLSAEPARPVATRLRRTPVDAPSPSPSPW